MLSILATFQSGYQWEWRWWWTWYFVYWCNSITFCATNCRLKFNSTHINKYSFVYLKTFSRRSKKHSYSLGSCYHIELESYILFRCRSVSVWENNVNIYLMCTRYIVSFELNNSIRKCDIHLENAIAWK